MNPILGTNFGQNLSQFQKMFQTLKGMSNPQQALNQLISTNPRSKEIMDYVGKYKGDYKTAFMDKAKEMGIDPQEFMNTFK